MAFEIFRPDLILNDIYGITPELLHSRGITALILDIDNTLVTYDDPTPTEPVRHWFSRMTDAGVSLAFVSNNDTARVELFNRDTGFFASAKSGKPSTRALRAAMQHMGSNRNNTAVVGDQLFTDIFAGRRLGLPGIFVYPIKDKKTLFFRFKRALEKPLMKHYLRLNERNDVK